MENWDRCTGCMERWIAELQVQRTIKKAQLLKKAVGPTVVHVGNKGIMVGLWKGEM